MSSPGSQASASKVDMHQIGEVAERVGLSLRTVRYYEEMGLITPEKRTDGGFRLYTDENIDRLLLIMQMKPIGFKVDEMRDLLDARDALWSPDMPDADRQRAADQLVEFARYARKRCAKVRRHLAAGEELAEQLLREGREKPPAPAESQVPSRRLQRTNS